MNTGLEREPMTGSSISGPSDSELPDQVIPTPLQLWPEEGYRVIPNLKTGAILGSIAGCTSLIANIIGSLVWPAISGFEQDPLRLIQVYLTFPLGESALKLSGGPLLAAGCVLYLLTGMLYGVIFEFSVSYFAPHTDRLARLVLFSGLAITVWAVNFYVFLIWLQPLLLGGSWIVDLIPWWVGLLTHLVFGWTMAIIYPLGIRGTGSSVAKHRLHL